MDREPSSRRNFGHGRRAAPRPLAIAAVAGHRTRPVGRFLAVRPRARHGRHGRRGPETFSAVGQRRPIWRPISPWPAARKEVAPLDMTKWFDTNYHYLVPEFEPGMNLPSGIDAPIDAFLRPGRWESTPGRCCSGPFRSCCWARASRPSSSRSGCSTWCRSMKRFLGGLPRPGPIGCRSTSRCWPSTCRRSRCRALQSAYARLGAVSEKIKICLATYFGDLRDNLRQPCSCRWRQCISTWSAPRNNWIAPCELPPRA